MEGRGEKAVGSGALGRAQRGVEVLQRGFRGAVCRVDRGVEVDDHNGDAVGTPVGVLFSQRSINNALTRERTHTVSGTAGAGDCV